MCQTYVTPNPQSTNLFNLNFYTIEVVSRYCKPQLQMVVNSPIFFLLTIIGVSLATFPNVLGAFC